MWTVQKPNPVKLGRENILVLPCEVSQFAKNSINSIEKTFDYFLPEEVLKKIAHYSNLYVEKYNERAVQQGKNQIEWMRTNAEEIRAFIGFLILSGVLLAQKEPLHSLWEGDAAFQRPIFSATFGRNRFIELLRFIRFDDKESRKIREETDKLAAIREILEMIREKFQDAYYPSDSLTIDEQLIRFYGHCKFRVYMPSKPDKYGIKVWVLADASNGYCLNFEVYTGKPIGADRERNQGMRVVLQLTNHLPGGYNITTDNFFTSIQLAEALLNRPNSMTLVGTIRKNKPELPEKFVNPKGRQVYSSIFAFADKMTLVSYVPKPRKTVTLLSTMHHDAIIDEQDRFKPEIIKYYNKTKIGVDLLDQMLKYYRCYRRTARWPLVLFLNLIDIACLNAYILWIKLNPLWKDKQNTKRRQFLLELSKSLVLPYIDHRDTSNLHKPILRAIEVVSNKSIKREMTAGVVGNTDPTIKRGRCIICPRLKDRKIPSKCSQCKEFVCAEHSTITSTVVCQRCQGDKDFLDL